MSFEPLRRYAAALLEAAKALSTQDARALIARSHTLIAAKLTKKAREAALGAKAVRAR
jgi:predicted DNA-binding protein (MmcQ/YjbR family)